MLILTHTDSQLVNPGETWEVHDDGFDSLYTDSIGEIRRTCLFTIGSEYLRYAFRKAARITIVKNCGIVGFAILKMRVDTATLMAIATSSLGLGSRLMNFQRGLASNNKTARLYIDAMKPLNEFVYPHWGFKEISMESVDPERLVTMMTGISAEDAFDDILNTKISHMKKRKSSKIKKDVAPEAILLQGYVSSFLWNSKGNKFATESLRKITRRARLTKIETNRLWSMRFRCLKKEKSNLNTDETWFERGFVMSEKARSLCKLALGAF